MRFAACPPGRSARPSWSSEARDAPPAPSTPRLLPQARRRRALALVQPTDGCGRGDPSAHRNAGPARGQDLQRAGGAAGSGRLIAGSAAALRELPQLLLEPRDHLLEARDLVLRPPDRRSPALDLAAGAVPLPEGRGGLEDGLRTPGSRRVDGEAMAGAGAASATLHWRTPVNGEIRARLLARPAYDGVFAPAHQSSGARRRSFGKFGRARSRRASSQIVRITSGSGSSNRLAQQRAVGLELRIAEALEYAQQEVARPPRGLVLGQQPLDRAARQPVQGGIGIVAQHGQEHRQRPVEVRGARRRPRPARASARA